jgi:hypothetical protein
VCGDCRSIVVGKDAADEIGGFAAVAAVPEMGAFGFLLTVFVITADALVDTGGVGVPTAGHRDVEQCAAGVLAEHSVASVGGDALGRVHGDRIAEVDVLT